MAMTATIYATECVWGSSSFNNNSDLKVGKTGSSSSDGTQYRGRLRFAAIPSNWVIKSIALRLTRIDAYNAHTLSFGGSTSNAFGASLAFSLTSSVSKGKGNKSIALTPYAATIQGLGEPWYLHIRHGSGTNSYTEFNGDEDAAGVKPALIITYELATVWYNKAGTWTQCEVWYNKAGAWIRCIPYYNSGGVWKQV